MNAHDSMNIYFGGTQHHSKIMFLLKKEIYGAEMYLGLVVVHM